MPEYLIERGHFSEKYYRLFYALYMIKVLYSVGAKGKYAPDDRIWYACNTLSMPLMKVYLVCFCPRGKKQPKASAYMLVGLFLTMQQIPLYWYDRAERHDFWPQLWLFFSPFLFPPKKREKKKRRMVSKNCDQKSCLSARCTDIGPWPKWNLKEDKLLNHVCTVHTVLIFNLMVCPVSTDSGGWETNIS